MLAFLLLSSVMVLQQDDIEFKEAASKGFHRSVLRAAAQRVRDKKMQRGDLIRLRIAMMSPAFRKRVEDLAIIQIASSDSDLVGLPVDDQGRLIRSKIDWDGFAEFLERLVPLILKIIDAILGAT